MVSVAPIDETLQVLSGGVGDDEHRDAWGLPSLKTPIPLGDGLAELMSLGLGLVDILLWKVMAVHADNSEGKVGCYTPCLAHELQVNERTIRRGFAKLQQAGLISKATSGGRPSWLVYSEGQALERLLFPFVAFLAWCNPPRTKCPPTPDKMSAPSERDKERESPPSPPEPCQAEPSPNEGVGVGTVSEEDALEIARAYYRLMTPSGAWSRNTPQDEVWDWLGKRHISPRGIVRRLAGVSSVDDVIAELARDANRLHSYREAPRLYCWLDARGGGAS